MSQQTISGGGAFTKKNIDDVNANFTELYAGTGGQTLASPTITGTVAGGATYSSPTFVTPVLGAATGTSVNLAGNCRAASYNVGATAGATGGTFTTISSITVVNGIITAISGS